MQSDGNAKQKIKSPRPEYQVSEYKVVLSISNNKPYINAIQDHFFNSKTKLFNPGACMISYTH